MRTYGWRPDVPDKRDKYTAMRLDPSALPRQFDNSTRMPLCWEQGALGACTAFAVGGAMAYEYARLGVFFQPSFLQPYYCARAMEGSIPIDAGAYIRDICKVSAQMGVSESRFWPYVPYRFAQRPPKAAFKNALNQRVLSYARVPRTVASICSVLASADTIVFGVSVYESFESDVVTETGFVPLPDLDEDLLGGHAVLMVGYDQDKKLFKARNSWGEQWGDNGYFYLPYDYVLDPDLSDDFWTLRTVTPQETTP